MEGEDLRSPLPLPPPPPPPPPRAVRCRSTARDGSESTALRLPEAARGGTSVQVCREESTEVEPGTRKAFLIALVLDCGRWVSRQEACLMKIRSLSCHTRHPCNRHVYRQLCVGSDYCCSSHHHTEPEKESLASRLAWPTSVARLSRAWWCLEGFCGLHASGRLQIYTRALAAVQAKAW